MRKLVIASLALAIGAAAQAAVVQWSIYDDSLENATRVYSFVGGDVATTMAAYLTSGNYTSSSEFESAIASYTADGVNDSGYVEGQADAGSGNALNTMSILFIDGTEAGDSVYVASNIDSSAYAFEPGTPGPGMMDLSGTALNSGVVTYKTSPVPPTPIPEPTSGLLMLLGMAGLALKRKRA